MIFHSIPWETKKDIGVYYNKMMSLVGKKDWVCFLDGDAVHTTTFFGKNIEDIVKKNKDFGLFTCMTNRVVRKYQIPENVDVETNCQNYHREFGKNLFELKGHNVLDITSEGLLSGVLILISKKTWLSVGGFLEENMLGVDNDIHRKCRENNIKVGLMEGIYVQHWYRNNNPRDTQHLKKQS